MKSLERLAKESFEKYSLRQTGRKANWDYLSEERQKVWKQDLFELIDMILLEVRSSVKPIPPNESSYNTSYANGHQEGKKEERAILIQLLQDIHEEYEAELQDE